jgi:CzcA family heavy metal efflux pump
MLERLIGWSLDNRLAVFALALLALGWGALSSRSAPVDVFPDLTAPTVTVMVEAPGLATEEVERQVTVPIEAAVAGADGVRRVRSQSVPGFALVWVEFDWGRDIYLARQAVTERLGQVGALPEGVPPPQLGPISSIMGEIMYVGLRATAPATAMEAREIAEWVVTPQLLALPGIAQVVSLGGEVRQYQVLVQPERLRALGVDLAQVQAAVAAANRNASGGLVERGGRDYLVRFLGRTDRLEDIREAVVAMREGVPVRVRHVASVAMGAALPVGDGGVNGEPGVVLAIAKQPHADTLALTDDIGERLAELGARLPPGIELAPDLFRQADFIRLAVDNVGKALRDGAIFVTVVLFVFLLNVRTTVISLLAIPISLAAALVGLSALGIGINTMTLGGMTIAVGALVDDAIIFVESIYRRLKENSAAAAPQPARDVVARACSEVRQPVFFSTLIIMLVFLPLFFLGGVEGRLLQPLGIAYLIAVAASLLVALTVTPALSHVLLARSRAANEPQQARPVLMLRAAYRPLLAWSIAHARWIAALSLLLVLLTLLAVTQLGRSFLPEFNEGSLTIEMATPAGTALSESARLARAVEIDLMTLPEVLAVARRTGRAEKAEHTAPPHVSEIDVRLGPLPQGKAAFLAELRELLAQHPGIAFNIGQPISHRIDHMLTGVRANLAIKIFGPSLAELRRLGDEIEQALQNVDGLVDVAAEPQAEVPQWRLRPDRDALARYGVTVGMLAEQVETAWRGAVVSDVLEGNRRFELVVRLPDDSRGELERLGGLTLVTPSGHTVALGELIMQDRELGAGAVQRENGERRLAVSANVAGRDLRSAVTDARAEIAARVALPPGYRVEFGGQFEAEAQATNTLLVIGMGVLLGILLLLWLALRSLLLALLVMINVPLALVGGVIAVIGMGGTLTIAALVGFITLFGIAVRSGLLLIGRYQTLQDEGFAIDEVIMEGSLERLTPILMTALTAALALIPLALGLGEPGTEIQAPMAWVILGGLISATALNMIVVPALYYLFTRPRVS